MIASLYAADFWRSLLYFNLYRLLVGLFFAVTAWVAGPVLPIAGGYSQLFVLTSLLYVVCIVLSFVLLRLRRPHFVVQLALQMVLDISCFSILSFATGGIGSSITLLLLISLAAAGLVSRGRITLFFAALATLATLIQHSMAVWSGQAATTEFMHAGLLCVSYFAVAWLAHTLARNAIINQELAQRRGRDLLSLSEANRLVMRDVQDGVLVIDGAGIIKQMNQSADRLLSQHVEAGAVLADTFPVLYQQFLLWKQTGEASREVLQFISGGQAKLRFVAIERDAQHGVVIFLEDMRRVQAEAQQIKLVALGRLTANIAHEVRNPLSAISYATELLQEETHNPEQQRLLQVIFDNTRRINHIVQDVMQLNRRDRANIENFRLYSFLSTFVDEFCLAKRLEPGVLCLEGDFQIEISFDRDHLRQILWNLCANAYRHGKKQAASLRLVSRGLGIRRWLDVIDDGDGVAEAQVGQLFEPFFTTASDGTGLGLYIARELCEANGGALVYYKADTGGACFRINFRSL